jgi:hypothetical protein
VATSKKWDLNFLDDVVVFFSRSLKNEQPRLNLFHHVQY